MSSQITLLTDDIGSSLSLLVAQAQDRLTLVAPFITQGALERLVAGVGRSVALTVFTRWRLEEIVAGVCDLRVFDTVQTWPGSRLLLHPRLHAKVVLIDDDVAVVGSANITDSALAFRSSPNVEVMAELRPVPNQLFFFLRQLEREAYPATDELRQRLEQAAQSLPPPATYPEVEEPPASSERPAPLFPSFRSPDRLYEGYLSVQGFRDRETRETVLDDLHALSLSEGLDENEFKERVGRALLEIPEIAAFDEFVAKPRFFREMIGWLKERRGEKDQEPEHGKHYLQTVIRWLMHFLPGRYRLEEPNYSELFGRSDGWEGRSPP